MSGFLEGRVYLIASRIPPGLALRKNVVLSRVLFRFSVVLLPYRGKIESHVLWGPEATPNLRDLRTQIENYDKYLRHCFMNHIMSVGFVYLHVHALACAVLCHVVLCCGVY